MTEIKGFQGEYRWLSNMWPCEIEIWGKKFPSSEHAYVWTKLKDDERESRYEELIALEPRQSKVWGRKIDLRDDWTDADKLDIMARIIDEKFYQNRDLAEKLLSTGDVYIEETNDWGDVFFGVCDGKGKNHLGRMIMDTRNCLRVQKSLGLWPC